MTNTYEADLAEFEHKLLSAGYEQLEPFFLLHEGELYDERDGSTQSITPARMRKLADTLNARVLSNDASPIIIGHTKRHLPEDQQPPIVGYAPRWEVTQFHKTGKLGLRSTPWAKPGKVRLSTGEMITHREAFDRFPRRSAEFWTDPDIIDPISILGANTPRLDLGIHQLQRQRQSIHLQGHYRPRTPIILEMDTMPVPSDLTTAPATPGNMGDASIFESDRFKRLEDGMSQCMEMCSLLKPFLDELRSSQMPGGGMGGGMGGPPGMGPGGPPQGPPQAAAAPEPPVGDVGGGGGDDDDDDDTPVQAAAAVAGGTNTMLPQQYDRRGAGQPSRQSRGQHAQRGARGSADPRDAKIEQLEYTVAALQLQRIEDTVNSTLDDLEEKIIFDRAREFQRLTKLSKAEFDTEVAYMLNTYKEKEEPLPPEAVPLQMHAKQPNRQTMAGAGPMTLQQYRESLATPPDPAMVQSTAQKSTYDKLVDIVRNRGKNGKPLMAAYEEVMGRVDGGTGGGTISPR